MEKFENLGGSVTNSGQQNSTAIKVALKSHSAISFGAGTYQFSERITYQIGGSSSLTLIGSGADVTVLEWNEISDGIELTYSNNNCSSHIRNLTISTNQNDKSKGLSLVKSTIDQNPANGPLSDITGVTIRGANGYANSQSWKTGIILNGISNINLTDINITGTGGAYSTNGTGLLIEGVSPGSVAFNITRATINYVNTGIIIGANVQGVTVSQSNLTGNTYGIYVPVSGKNTGQSMLVVTNGNQFNCATAAINIETDYEGVVVTNNMFIIPNGSPSIGVQLLLSNTFNIVGNSFVSAGGTSQNGVVIAGYGNGAGIVSGNSFGQINPTNIWLQDSSQYVNVQGNSSRTGSTINTGTNNSVGNATD